jgi:hypothetical protein
MRTINHGDNGGIGSGNGGRKREQKGGVFSASEDKTCARRNDDQLEEKISWIKGGIQRFHLTKVFEIIFFA